MKLLRAWAHAAFVFSGVLAAYADPKLELVKSGTSSTHIDWVIVGTSTYSLDLRANTDGNPVGCLQYYITTSPANVVKYDATTPLVALDNPFVAADLTGYGSVPAAGATVNSDSAANTTWFKASAPDYNAFADQSIGRYKFNIGSLDVGASVVFTPVGVLLSYGGGEEISTFASPVTFSLQVIPEPGSSVLLGAGGAALMILRKRRSRRCRFA
ncbi:MAG: PEP-CTERM sorting domain-containing protein [Verrucomicrobia bacterium]|nr:PEP-CTERM sorting domain-containing protein [Verrucomicrobiota bacterium]